MQSDRASGLRRLISLGIRLVKKSPYVWYYTWRIIPKLKVLLPHERDFFGLRHLAEGKQGLLVDVGANTGISALGFRALGIEYDILSIEANGYHEPALRRVKKKIRRFDYKILGAGSERAQLTLYTPVYHGIAIHTMTSGKLEYAQHIVGRDFSPRIQGRMRYEAKEVEVVPLDDLELRPNIIKIDVEGLDYQVLLGLQRTIAAHRPYILIEYTPDEVGGNAEEFFAGYCYSLFTYDSERDTFIPFQPSTAKQRWEDNTLQVNLFCIPNEKATGIPLRPAEG
jgi:FkbM family methyltransferase